MHPPASGSEQLPQGVTPRSVHRGGGARVGEMEPWLSWTEFLLQQTPRCERAWLIQRESPGGEEQRRSEAGKGGGGVVSE